MFKNYKTYEYVFVFISILFLVLSFAAVRDKKWRQDYSSPKITYKHQGSFLTPIWK